MTSLIVALYLAAVPTVAITGKVLTPDGSGVRSGTITCRLTTPGSALDGTTLQRVASEVTTTLAATTGAVSFSLVPNDAITPTGSRYTCTYRAVANNGRSVQWAEQWQLASTPNPLPIGAAPVPTYPLGACAPAASPIFVPASGATVLSDQTVAMSSNTPDAVIYYTTDGSTPTNQSAVYSAPVVVPGGGTLKAVATPTLGWSPSSVATATYTILDSIFSPYDDSDTLIHVVFRSGTLVDLVTANQPSWSAVGAPGYTPRSGTVPPGVSGTNGTNHWKLGTGSDPGDVRNLIGCAVVTPAPADLLTTMMVFSNNNATQGHQLVANETNGVDFELRWIAVPSWTKAAPKLTANVPNVICFGADTAASYGFLKVNGRAMGGATGFQNPAVATDVPFKIGTHWDDILGAVGTIHEIWISKKSAYFFPGAQWGPTGVDALFTDMTTHAESILGPIGD